MQIHVFNEQSDLPLSLKNVPSIVKAVIAFEGKKCDEVAIHFVDTKTICRLHEQFFDDASPTDCISFPMDSADEKNPYTMLGEVFVCPKTALEYAKKHRVDVYEETTLYLIHGLLHLMGYDDISIKACTLMRSAEKRHMTNLIERGLIIKNLKSEI